MATAAISASPASAQAARYWERYCGGSTFMTCASVYLELGPSNTVTLRIWNLAGLSGLGLPGSPGTSGWENGRITTVGFYGMGAVALGSGTTTSGTAESYGSPTAWTVRQSESQGAQGLTISGDPDRSAISSDCRTAQPAGSSGWLNPCSLPTDPTGQALGWVTIRFSYGGAWDLQGTALSWSAQGSPTTACDIPDNCRPTEVVPEPISIVLLGSGLAGMGGVGLLRRRRERQARQDD